jgi:cell division protein FtsB
VGVVLSLLLLLAIASLGSYRDLAAAKERQQYLEKRIDDTLLRNDQFRNRIERLQSDPASLERVAREQYRMQRPDDVVIVFPDDDERQTTGPKRNP